jgi:hypothetical protein
MSYRLTRWRLRRREMRWRRMLAALPPEARLFIIMVVRAAR